MSVWVDKYKPKITAELAGQARNVARIKSWLKTFEPSRSQPLFIYGPPGIGKTTAVHLCCKETGYQTIEFNASDQRNKNVIRDVISIAASNTRLNFFGRASDTKDAIILDEVDGMAGNEDRGGIAQLIIELKSTKKPMIFICNDGQHQKLRSLKDKCETIEFRKPDFDTIRAVVKKVSSKENFTVDDTVIRNLAESSDYDIRQIINSLSLFKGSESKQVAKTTRLNAFEATKTVLTASQNSIETRFDCFFADYNIMPLFMFENYIKNKPAKGDQLKAISKAADALCLSDLADKQIRSNQYWSLLNTQALLSTVIPSKLVESHTVGRTDFPQFLGKLSNANKRLRLTQELNAHMCLSLRGGLDADYLDAFRERISAPLIRKDKLGGVDTVIDFMHDYYLLKDDINSIMELSTWSFKPDPMTKVDSKTKTALTLAYKKRSIALPYFVDDKTVKKRKPVGLSNENDVEGEEDDDDEEEVAMKPKRVIKHDKPPTKKKNAKVEKESSEGEKKPAKGARAKKNTSESVTNGRSKVPDPAPKKKNSSDEPEIIVEKPAPDKRPPPNGIARFFESKRQKSS